MKDYLEPMKWHFENLNVPHLLKPRHLGVMTQSVEVPVLPHLHPFLQSQSLVVKVRAPARFL